jgi:triphosphatase
VVDVNAGRREQNTENAAGLSLAQLAAGVALEQLTRILKHEEGTRLGKDPEELHKMRVATRRLRVAFKVFGTHLERAGITQLPLDEVRTVARALGGVRDLDVFDAWLADQTAMRPDDAGAIDRLRAERMARLDDARAAMLEALDGPAMAALRDGPLAVTLDVVGRSPDRVKKRRRVRRAGRKLALRALKRLRRDGNGLMAPTSEELHRVRIQAKRFRYVCEFVSPAFGSALDEPIDAATAVQDALGDLHDADVAVPALLHDVERVALGAEHAGDAAAIARLVAAQQARRDEALLRFRAAWGTLPDAGRLREALRRARQPAGAAESAAGGASA